MGIIYSCLKLLYFLFDLLIDIYSKSSVTIDWMGTYHLKSIHSFFGHFKGWNIGLAAFCFHNE